MKRLTVAGVARVVAFNWPRYVAAIIAVAAGLTAPVPETARLTVRFATAVTGVWILVSLVATWWVYDRSPLYGWRWLTALLPVPARCLVISTGLDEASAALRDCYPDAELVLIDLFDPGTTRGGSIRRAHALVAPAEMALASRPDRLAADSSSMDAVFLVFAAHELRDPPLRRALFVEIARVLRPGGRLLLVEHCRDAANIVAYGPGAWHFYPRRVWTDVAREAGLWMAAETTMTPLVRAFAFQR